MNQRLLFWIPAGLRLLVVLVGSLLLGLFFGPVVGLTVGLLALTVAVLVDSSTIILLADPIF